MAKKGTRAYLLALALGVGTLLAFSGVGLARQAPEAVRSWSPPEYEGLGVVPSQQDYSPQQERTRVLVPAERTLSASAVSPSATTLLQ